MAVRTTVVGSWIWPVEAAGELARYHRGQLDTASGEELLRRCATQAIAEQRELGLDEWTGGEYYTDNFIDQLKTRLTGIEVDVPAADDVFDYDDFGHARIVGDIDAPYGMGYLEAFLRERDLPGGVPKATVVSPLELTLHEADQSEALQRQMPRLCAIVNRELRGLADAGCQHVALDAPVFGAALNTGRLTADEIAPIIIDCFKGVTATRGLHMCNGNLKGRPHSSVLRCAPWVDLLERLDGVVDVPCLAVSYFPQYLEREAFTRMPQSMQLAAGIVDEASYWVEPVRKLRERAADWARVIGEERLWIAPSCGFGRHPARNRPILLEKVQNMVEAAASL